MGRWVRDHALAQTLLEALFAPTSRKSPKGPTPKPEWKCSSCSTNNFMSRAKCRWCAESRTATPPAPAAKAAAQPSPPKLAPWAKARAAASQATALEAAISAARAAGGDEPLVAGLEAKLTNAKKAATDDRPLHDQVAGCQNFIARARKRLEKADAAVREATEYRDKLIADIDEHLARLTELEQQVEDARASSDEAMQEAPKPAGASAVAEDAAELKRQLEAAQLEQAQAAHAAAETEERLRDQLRLAHAEAAALRGENESFIDKGQKLEAERHSLELKLQKAKVEQRRSEQESSEMRALGKAALKSRLGECFKEHNTALLAEDWDAAAALAETTRKLTAALRDALD